MAADTHVQAYKIYNVFIRFNGGGAGWAEIASRLKYRPVIAGYFHLKKRNFGRILMVKINKVDRSFRRDRIDPQ